MNRLTRITAILIQLQSKRVVTAKEISERFSISPRTVYRDIRILQEAGVPIGSENGVGYFIADTYNLPPVSLTEEEANALIVSEIFIEQQGDQSLKQHYRSLLIKIKSTLENFQQENVEKLADRTQTFTKEKPAESNSLSLIQKSIADSSVLAITYLSLYKNEITERNIAPQAVYYTNQSWIVIAWCYLRKDLREFRLDKIRQLSPTDLKYHADTAFRLDRYFQRFQN